MYEIKQLSQEEIEAERNRYPLMPASTIKEFQVLDDGLSLDYHDTREEAEAGVRMWQSQDTILAMIRYRLPLLISDLEAEGSQHGVDSDEIRKMIRSEL